MEDKRILYLVYWDNNKWVGGYEKRNNDYVQVFNDPIRYSFVYDSLKKYKEIKIMTQADFGKEHKLYFLDDFLQDYCETLPKEEVNQND